MIFVQAAEKIEVGEVTSKSRVVKMDDKKSEGWKRAFQWSFVDGQITQAFDITGFINVRVVLFFVL